MEEQKRAPKVLTREKADLQELEALQKRTGLAVVTRSCDRVDGRLKVTGKLAYGGDYPQEGFLHGKILREPLSPRPDQGHPDGEGPSPARRRGRADGQGCAGTQRPSACLSRSARHLRGEGPGRGRRGGPRGRRDRGDRPAGPRPHRGRLRAPARGLRSDGGDEARRAGHPRERESPLPGTSSSRATRREASPRPTSSWSGPTRCPSWSTAISSPTWSWPSPGPTGSCSSRVPCRRLSAPARMSRPCWASPSTGSR